MRLEVATQFQTPPFVLVSMSQVVPVELVLRFHLRRQVPLALAVALRSVGATTGPAVLLTGSIHMAVYIATVASGLLKIRLT